MVFFVHGVLLLWLAAVPAACWSRWPKHLVLAAAFVLGLLFLPMVTEFGDSPESGAFSAILLPGLSLTKYKVISLAVLLAVLLTDRKRLAQLRLSWVDLPMLAWCLLPIPSVLGGPPPADGSDPFTACLSQCLGTFLLWGVPYFVGKLYFGSFERLRDLAIIFVLGALLYIPLCLYEVRMSPQLHNRLYGFTQHDFAQTMRFDGFRPMVFMQHGIALGLYMCLAALVGFVLWRYRAGITLSGMALPRFARLFPWLLLVLAVTTVLIKSTGALLLVVVGFGALVVACRLRTIWPLAILLLISPQYLTARTSGAWSGVALLPLLQTTLGQERAESFEFRQTNEEMLMARAFEGPAFGWGGWGRNFVRDKDGTVLTIPDGLWIIALGERGLPGLITLWLAMLLPVVRFLWQQPVSTWSTPRSAAAMACAFIVVLYMIDNLMNGMHNPVFIAMAGALAALPRTKLAEPPPPLSVTDRRVFRHSLTVTRTLRSGMTPTPEKEQR